LEGLHVEGEYIEENGVGIVNKDCENIGVAFDGPELREFILNYVVPVADEGCRAQWRALFD
jgi:hypothetical protein